MNLQRINIFTPRFKLMLSQQVSRQEHKILIAIAKIQRDDNENIPFIKQIKLHTKQKDNTYITMLLNHLTRKGFLKKITKNLYQLKDHDLYHHLLIKQPGKSKPSSM